MARKGLVEFFTNTDNEGKPVEGASVAAPAFSITKVLSAASVIIAPAAAAVGQVLSNGELQAGHVVALALGLMGFLAIASSADVIARAITAKRGDGGSDDQRDTANLIPFGKSLPGALIAGGPNPNVDIIAATGGTKAYFLVKRGADLEWLPADAVKLR